MKTYTVEQLRDELNQLIEQGFGHRLVLTSNADPAINASFATLGKVENDDLTGACIYLTPNVGEEEKDFWDGK